MGKSTNEIYEKAEAVMTHYDRRSKAPRNNTHLTSVQGKASEVVRVLLVPSQSQERRVLGVLPNSIGM